jgi:PAS domain S-box-containing protein
MELQESNLNHFLDALLQPAIVVDKAGNISFINESGKSLFGWDTNELSGKSFSAIFLAERPLSVKTEIQQRIAELQQWSGEIEINRQNGSLLSAMICMSKFPTLNSDNDKALLLFSDLTRLKTRENELAEREARFRSFYDNSTICIYRTTPAGQVLMANPALIQMLGYDSFEDLTSINLEETGFAVDSPRADFIALIEQEGSIRGRETYWTRKNGSKVYLRESAVGIRDKAGKVMYYEGTVEDITDRRIIEQKLQIRDKYLSNINEINILALSAREPNELFEVLSAKLTELLDADNCYITFWDEDKNRTVPFYASNMPAEAYRNQSTDADEITMTESVLRAGHVLMAEDVFNTPYLSKKIAAQFPNKSLLAVPMISNDKKLGAILVGYNNPHVFTDEEVYYTDMAAKEISLIVDKIKRLEDLRVNEQKLRQMNAEKDKLFSIISHDLRSPFSAILGLSEALTEDIDYFTQDQIITYTASIHQSAYRLIENLLAWSNLGSGKFKPVLTEEQLWLIVDEIMQTLVHTADNKDIELKTEVDHRITLKTDANMLMTILRNLVSNAIKFTPRGGKVMLKATQADGGETIIYCIDSGIGMKQELIDNLFRFTENTSSRGTENEAGTGLGLVLCKEFAQKLHGTIKVESKPGEGSKFILILPPQN